MATGMMPGRFGVFNNGMKATIPEEVTANSLGKLMKRAGYATFYGGKTHLPPELEPKSGGYDVIVRDQRDKLSGACLDFITQDRDEPFSQWPPSLIPTTYVLLTMLGPITRIERDWL